MIEVGPPPKEPLQSGGATPLPARPANGAVPVQLLQPARLPESLPSSGTLAALVEPGSQAGIVGDLLQLSTEQGPLTIQSPVMLAAGTQVTLQLVTIAGRPQLFLIPPRAATDLRASAGKATIAAEAAKPNLDSLVPGRPVTATVVRAAARGDTPSAARPAGTTETAALAAGEEAAPEQTGVEPAAMSPSAAAGTPAAAAGAPAVPASSVPAAATAPTGAPPAAPGAAPESASPQASLAASTRAPASSAGQAFAGMAPGQQLTLTVVSISPQPSAAPDTAPAAPPGKDTVASLTPSEPQTESSKPALAASATPATGAPSAPAGARLAAPAPLPQAAPAAAQSAPAGPPAAVSAAQAPQPSIAAPASPAAAPLGAAPVAPSATVPIPDAITVATNVVGSDAAGQPIVEAGSVLLLLESKAPPVGSEIVLALPRSAADPATQPAATAPTEFAPLEEVAREATLQGGALQQTLNALLPRSGPALAAQLALYVGALRQGQASSWLGNAVLDQLEKTGKRSTSQRLAAAFADAAQANSGAQRAVGWLSFTLPLLEAGVIQPIHFYVQRRSEEEDKQQAKPETEQGRRFLIDFTLTRLGGIQLDGLARGGRLDLIVRTSSPMGGGLRGDLDRLFADVTSARGIAGTLIFQVAPPLPAPVQAKPQATPKAQAGGILV